MAGHAGRSIHFQQPGPVLPVQDEVDLALTLATQRGVGVSRRTAATSAATSAGRSAGQKYCVSSGEVLVFVVIIAAGRDDLDHRQSARRRSTQHGDGRFAARDELFGQHLGVETRGQLGTPPSCPNKACHLW